MNNEKLLKEIQNMVRLLPFSTLPGFHLNTKGISQPSISNILNNTHDDGKNEKISKREGEER